MHRTTTLLGLLAAPLLTLAQPAFGGRPFGLSAPKYGLPAPQQVTLPEVDVAARLAEDALHAQQGRPGPARFGVVHTTAFDLQQHGSWHAGPDGLRIWQLALHCPGAQSVGLTFTDFRLPEGVRVFMYDPIGPYRGAFTAASAPGMTSMGTVPLAGSTVVVEVQEPAAVAGLTRLTIGEVIHAYRDPFGGAKGFGDSGSCNINVICPDGDPWRDQIRSVALILAGGGSCTGQLLNNCAEDGTPYFLTANHCVSGSTANWVFVFNWDSPTCTPTNNAPDNETVAGSTLLVNDPGTDVALLELSAAPPDSFNVFYSGWDNSGAFPDSLVGIHHPRGDIKKISRDLDPPLQGTFGNPPAQCWHIQTWDHGTTEPGSSGSGVWDQNKRLVGQLFGGQADCSNSVNDYYGRFDLSWPLLEPHLGTCGSTLDGWDPNGTTPVTNDAAVTAIFDLPEQLCGIDSITPYVTLKNNGTGVLTSATLLVSVDAGAPVPEPWSGSLQPGQTMNVPLGTLTIGNGTHTLTVASSLPNGLPDGNPANDASSKEFLVAFPAQNVSIILTLDAWGSETTWELATDQGTVIDGGGPYQNGAPGAEVELAYCLGDGCYTFTMADLAGDGICCDYGNGGLVILDGDSVLLAESDGQFADLEEVTFCITGTGIASRDGAAAFTLWPNPANDQLTVECAWAERITVYDLTGRPLRVHGVRAGAVRHAVDITTLAAGGYVVECTGGGLRRALPLLVQH